MWKNVPFWAIKSWNFKSIAIYTWISLPIQFNYVDLFNLTQFDLYFLYLCSSLILSSSNFENENERRERERETATDRGRQVARPLHPQVQVRQPLHPQVQVRQLVTQNATAAAATAAAGLPSIDDGEEEDEDEEYEVEDEDEAASYFKQRR